MQSPKHPPTSKQLAGTPSGGAGERTEIELQTRLETMKRLRTPGAIVAIRDKPTRTVMNRVLAGARAAGLIDHPVPIVLDDTVPVDEYQVRIPESDTE